ncbi:MarR family transcriptional regulator [Asticcacaulis sp. AC466]|uniref:MarR family winged helix-turn-helix transcriptional regulator n=1 Tax=Asticcacaulis sp. AC466 TaxID=1282362 RepID=UPI0003C3D7FE|nr:MarR family transcriptional regulator [Asticcacaulis sp. AC466]ESQ82653.1 MarR family transcriptional regulator [Asticcacaulis sp. AC466]
MSASPPELRLENQLCFAVYSAAHAFAQAYKPHLDPMGLTYPQYLVMLLLWEQDGRSVNELGQPLQLDSGTLTPLLKRMEKGGFVTRQRDARDERVTRIHLTEHGKSLRDKARAIPTALLCASGLTLDQLNNLRDQVRVLGENLRE